MMPPAALAISLGVADPSPAAHGVDGGLLLVELEQREPTIGDERPHIVARPGIKETNDPLTEPL